MKTLSVRQPFAHIICAGIKDIENRTWRTNFRGRILIHAGATQDRRSLAEIFTQPQLYDLLKHNTENYWCGHKHYGLKYVHSAIIGSVEIVDCVRNHPSVWAEKDCWNWVLANPGLFLKPIENVKGKLSFWEYRIDFDSILDENKVILERLKDN
ncbi:MAG: ASCH domain-containing protein [Tannerellaceae bacterium]|jgi:hypothetical protein|nr:ASCH domain-containing protein [Tannerellaceae bacterium]